MSSISSSMMDPAFAASQFQQQTQPNDMRAAAEQFEALREAKGKDKDGLLLPEKMAETYFHLATQHRSAWSHEIDLRAYSDLAWWNHAVNI